MSDDYGDTTAPDGQIFVCMACGKWSKTHYGDRDACAVGWDESCMLNAALCYEDKLERDQYTRVTRMPTSAIVQHEVNAKWLEKRRLENYWKGQRKKHEGS